MNTDQILAEIREANLSYLMLAQRDRKSVV